MVYIEAQSRLNLLQIYQSEWVYRGRIMMDFKGLSGRISQSNIMTYGRYQVGWGNRTCYDGCQGVGGRSIIKVECAMNRGMRVRETGYTT